MQLEYINFSHDFSDNEFTKLLDSMSSNISTIILPSYYIRSAKLKIKSNTKISCLIDFPLGVSDFNSRIEACKYAIKNKADCLDIVIPSNLLANRKYDKIREELKSVKDISTESGIDVRYILEYRSFEHQCLKKICEILNSYNITTISLSTGYGLDALSDYIIASKFLTSAGNNMNIILSANFWSENHMNLIVQNNFYAVRSQYIKNLEYLAHFYKNA